MKAKVFTPKEIEALNLKCKPDTPLVMSKGLGMATWFACTLVLIVLGTLMSLNVLTLPIPSFLIPLGIFVCFVGVFTSGWRLFRYENQFPILHFRAAAYGLVIGLILLALILSSRS